MEKWFCTWENSDYPNNLLYLARPSPTSGTLYGILEKTQKIQATKRNNVN